MWKSAPKCFNPLLEKGAATVHQHTTSSYYVLPCTLSFDFFFKNLPAFWLAKSFKNFRKNLPGLSKTFFAGPKILTVSYSL